MMFRPRRRERKSPRLARPGRPVQLPEEVLRMEGRGAHAASAVPQVPQ